MILGYASPSRKGQTIAAQVEALKAVGCTKVLREKLGDADDGRPQLRAAIEGLKAGDVLVVTAVDRLADNTRELLEILNELRALKAGFRSLAEPLMDTTSEMADAILAALAVASDLERGRIAERTAEGRREAKERGVKFGRKPKLTARQKRDALKRIYAGEPQRAIAGEFNVSQATISRLAQEDIPPPPRKKSKKRRRKPARRKADRHFDMWEADAGFAGGIAGMLGVGGGYAIQKGKGDAAHYFRKAHPTGTEWSQNIYQAHRFPNAVLALDALVALQNRFEHEDDRKDEFGVVAAP